MLTPEEKKELAELKAYLGGAEVTPPPEQGLSPEEDEELQQLKTEMSEVDKSENFAYAFAKEGNFTRDAGDYLEALVPLGNVVMPWADNFEEDGFYMSPTEMYGEEWAEADTTKRLELIKEKRARDIEYEFGDFKPTEDHWSYTAGTVAKAVADPTTAVPFGRGVKAAVGVGSLVAGASSAAADLADKGEVDEFDVARDMAIGGLTAGAMQYGGSKVVDAVRKRSANKRVAKAQKILDDSGSKDVSKALESAGYTSKEIAEVGSAAKLTGKKLVVRKANKNSPDAEIESELVRNAATRPDSKLDKVLGAMSTRIANIHPALSRRVRQYEQNSKQRYIDYNTEAKPFVQAFRALGEEDRKQVGFLLSNSKFDEVTKIFGADSPIGQSLPQVKKLIIGIGKDLRKSGRQFEAEANYFPRLVKDYNKMSDELFDRNINNVINRKIMELADKKGGLAKVTMYEKDKIANQVLRNYDPIIASGKPSNLKQRVMKEIDADVHANYYADADEALIKYISGASHDIEMNKFFGRFGTENLETSIGALARSYNISSQQVDDLSSMLTARFTGGRQSAGKWNQIAKDIGYMGTIGQFTSTATQAGDLGVSAAMHGWKNTIAAFFEAGSNKSKIKLIDIALDDEIMTELASSPTLTSNLLNRVLTSTGFRAVDRLGKETIINSSFKMLQKQARKKPEAIRKKWGKYYGDDMDQLIEDLAGGKITPLTKEHAFATLSDFQPISMSELPEAYAKNPDMRILYMLKSFTLKMWDVARKNVYNEWKNGSKKDAVKTAGILALNLSATNYGIGKLKDMMRGRDVDIKPEDLPTDLMWTLLGVYGFGKYQAEKLGSQGIVETAAGLVIPPVPLATAAEVGYKMATESEFSSDNILDPYKKERVVAKTIPVAGDIAASWFMGGAEAYNTKKVKEDISKLAEID